MSPRLRTCWLASLGLVLAAVVGGCRTPTAQVDVTLDADACLRSRARVVRLLVWDADGGLVTDGGTVTEEIRVTAWPIRRTLVPRGGDATRGYRLEARVFDDAEVLLDTQGTEGGYVAGERSAVTLTFGGSSCMDAGVMDAGADDAPSTDAGQRAFDGLEVAYDFEERTGSTLATDCVAGADLALSAAGSTLDGSGLVVTTGLAHTDPLPPRLLGALTFGFSVEGWVAFDPASVAGDSPRNILGLYDDSEGLWSNNLRVSIWPFPIRELDAGALDAGPPAAFSELELLGGVTTNGDRYARPFRAASSPRARVEGRPMHFVYAWGGAGDEHLYVQGEEPRASWRREGGLDPIPRTGSVQPFGAGTSLWVGNYGSLSVRRIDGGVGEELFELPPGAATQFTGTYLLLAVYSRALTPDEVRLHHALGPDVSPCPR